MNTAKQTVYVLIYCIANPNGQPDLSNIDQIISTDGQATLSMIGELHDSLNTGGIIILYNGSVEMDCPLDIILEDPAIQRALAQMALAIHKTECDELIVTGLRAILAFCHNAIVNDECARAAYSREMPFNQYNEDEPRATL